MCNPAVVAGPEAGLLWIGQRNYTPLEFVLEAAERGVSRKLPAIARGLSFDNYVYLAHKRAIAPQNGTSEYSQGIFACFKPTHFDLVIDDETDVPERALKLAERWPERTRIIKVVPLQVEMFEA